jgi:hypothetical protein
LKERKQQQQQEQEQEQEHAKVDIRAAQALCMLLARLKNTPFITAAVPQF